MLREILYGNCVLNAAAATAVFSTLMKTTVFSTLLLLCSQRCRYRCETHRVLNAGE